MLVYLCTLFSQFPCFAHMLEGKGKSVVAFANFSPPFPQGCTPCLQIWLGQRLEKFRVMDLWGHRRAALLWLNHASRAGVGDWSPGVKVQVRCCGQYSLVHTAQRCLAPRGPSLPAPPPRHGPRHTRTVIPCPQGSTPSLLP